MSAAIASSSAIVKVHVHNDLPPLWTIGGGRSISHAGSQGGNIFTPLALALLTATATRLIICSPNLPRGKGREGKGRETSSCCAKGII